MSSDDPKPLGLEVASAICQGARPYQEDSLIADVTDGAQLSMVILSDGMGGHAAGDVASKIVVTEMFSELSFRGELMMASSEAMCDSLRMAALAANERIAHHTAAHPQTDGMGATLLNIIVQKNKLHWISIGDSPLFLFRGGKLRQLNQDHSMAPQIDLWVKAGLIPDHMAHNHPDRNVLTSVLCGEEITYIDCPEEPFELRRGDIILVASDGLQFLSDAGIAKVLRKGRSDTPQKICDALMKAVLSLGDPGQDNVSFAVLKVAERRKTHERWQELAAPMRSYPLRLIDPTTLQETAKGAGNDDEEPSDKTAAVASPSAAE